MTRRIHYKFPAPATQYTPVARDPWRLPKPFSDQGGWRCSSHSRSCWSGRHRWCSADGKPENRTGDWNGRKFGSKQRLSYERTTLSATSWPTQKTIEVWFLLPLVQNMNALVTIGTSSTTLSVQKQSTNAWYKPISFWWPYRSSKNYSSKTSTNAQSTFRKWHLKTDLVSLQNGPEMRPVTK